MTLDELIARLVEIPVRGSSDPESDHLAADEALLSFIADTRVREAFEAIPRWYS